MKHHDSVVSVFSGCQKSVVLQWNLHIRTKEPRDWHNLFAVPRLRHTVEPRYNEPLYDEVLGITNDLLYPSNSKIYEKEPRYNETSLSAADQDLQIRGPRSSRPWDKGGWRSQKKKNFLAFRALVWSKNKGGGSPVPLPLIRHCLQRTNSASPLALRCHLGSFSYIWL